jgi:hypothetical protein
LIAFIGCGSDREGLVPPTESGSDQALEVVCEPTALYEYEEVGPLPSWIAVSGDHVYWTEDRTGELSRMPIQGGVPEYVTGGVGAGWSTIVADDDHLFFVGADEQIHRIALDGTEHIALAASGGKLASEIQRSMAHVYWHSSTGDAGRSNFVAQVRRVNVDGGATEILWNSAPGTFSSGLAVAGGYLFVDQFNWSYPNELLSDGQVLRISDTTGEVVPLASGLLVPRVHRADDRYVYFSAQNSDRHNEVWRVSISGRAQQLLQPGTFETSVDVGQMLIQGDTVWWGEANRGPEGLRLYRANTTTGGAVPLVTMEAHHMLGLAGKGQYLYFPSSYSYDGVGPASIWRIASDCSTN